MDFFSAIIECDRELLVNINSLNAPFWDNIMWWISDRLVWIPLYLSIICYSRMYLGVHFPLDIVCGALVGVAAGYISYYLYKYTVSKFQYFNADKGVMENKQVLCIAVVYVLTFGFILL